MHRHSTIHYKITLTLEGGSLSEEDQPNKNMTLPTCCRKL